MASAPWVRGDQVEYEPADDRYRGENTGAYLQGDSMNTALTGICSVPGADARIRARWPDARLAPGSGKPAWERGTGTAQNARAGEPAHWQRILDLLDPGNYCGAWSRASFKGRPVVCTRAPHDPHEKHANAETGWRWSGQEP